MKKIIDTWMYGVGIGMFWYVLSLLIWKVPGQGTGQIMVTLICSGLMGLSAFIYDNKTKSLLFKTTLHFLVIFALVWLMQALNGWSVTIDLGTFLFFFIEFAVIYLLTWCFIYSIEKRKIAKINEKLRKKEDVLDKS